jgi:hypothetical protein
MDGWGVPPLEGCLSACQVGDECAQRQEGLLIAGVDSYTVGHWCAGQQVQEPGRVWFAIWQWYGIQHLGSLAGVRADSARNETPMIGVPEQGPGRSSYLDYMVLITDCFHPAIRPAPVPPS